MLSCYRTFALMPRGWISCLNKIPRPSNLHITYLSRYSMRCYSQTKYFPNGSIFFSNLQTCKYTLFISLYIRKNTSGWNAAVYLAKNYHDLQMCTRPTCRGILCDGISKKKYFPTGSIFFFKFTNFEKNGVFRRL